MILFRTLLTMNPCGFPSFRFFCAYSRVCGLCVISEFAPCVSREFTYLFDALLTLGLWCTLVPESCSCGTQPVWLAYCRAVLKRVKFLVSRIMAEAVTHEMPGTVRASEAFSMNSGSCISCSRISFSSLRMASFMLSSLSAFSSSDEAHGAFSDLHYRPRTASPYPDACKRIRLSCGHPACQSCYGVSRCSI